MIFRHNPYRPLEKAIGYRFWRKSRIEHALLHPSFRHEHGTALEDNQRLEFLGDAVLGLLAASHLYKEQPLASEGEMTKLRSMITSTKALASIAAQVDLGSYLRLGRGELISGGRSRTSILADAMEAVIGAAYLDGGMRAVRGIFRKLFKPVLSKIASSSAIENPKGVLQELAQRCCGENPRYVLVSETGPAHQRIYTTNVCIGDKIAGSGTGANKRESEIEAALDALNNSDNLFHLQREQSGID